ncbi:PEP-CTERM sorting domain-containing protein [Massilia sp. G4R7]|uniref:PEP-CTERM sorting domain-containing protein n=1 Tax=Massilia phyllostachyos TaxID=2898585 RepID=A0ABS8Q3Y2_9BURK|nr:PEP-CTERM sorting domain-containing protein [Massilia phyllostachyos]MCD2516450.1 PEP-CTERM sorting domain-containing protein [Massilia phyllostachyos]
MSYLKKIAGACAVAATLAAGNAVGAPITLSFEGVGDIHNIDTYYAGGTDTNGASGADHGIVFGSSFLGMIDTDAGGSGLFVNNPSGTTVATWLDGNDTAITVLGGFEKGFSLFYGALSAGYVNIYEGQNGTGELLATLDLSANSAACRDFNNLICNFTKASIAFEGFARSVVFFGQAADIALDDLTFGVDAASGDVPEPATLGLTALGLAGLIAARRKAAAKR